jgi:hypothetical protein
MKSGGLVKVNSWFFMRRRPVKRKRWGKKRQTGG